MARQRFIEIYEADKDSTGIGSVAISSQNLSLNTIYVCRWDAKKYGVLTSQSMLKKLQGEGYDTTVYNFGPGTVFGDHSHQVDKKDAILSGHFLFRMDGEEVCRQSQFSQAPSQRDAL